MVRCSVLGCKSDSESKLPEISFHSYLTTEEDPKKKKKPPPKPKPKPTPKPKPKPKEKKEEPVKYEDRYKKPIKSFLDRLKNLIRYNFRGVLGCLVPLALLSYRGIWLDNAKTVELVWMWMFWFFLMQPISVPATGMIPMVMFPLTGVLTSDASCICYFNDGIGLYIIGSMFNLLLNNSGFDRRLSIWLLCQGDACQFSPKRLIFKSCTAAFFLSMFSNRLIVTSILIQYISSALNDVHKWAGSTGANYPEIRNILCNAIQTTSAIGSFAIVHSSNSVLAARTIFFLVEGQVHDAYFNYLQYSAFAFPCSFVMFLINLAYHMVLINQLTPKVMDGPSKVRLRSIMINFRTSISKIPTCHEQLSVFFMLVALILFFTRKNTWFPGWATFRDIEGTESFILDTTVAAAFVVGLHMIPNRYQFLNLVTAEKKSKLPPKQAASSVLWWKFVDQHTNYSYSLLLGGGVLLYRCIKSSGLYVYMAGPAEDHTKLLYYRWYLSALFLCLMPTFMSNIMTSAAACLMFLPYVIYTVTDGPWAANIHLICVTVGIACNFGLIAHFLFTPPYYCYYTGKVPMKKMFLYNIVLIIMFVLVLWIFIMYWAPVIWQPYLPTIIIPEEVTGVEEPAPEAEAEPEE